MMGEDEILFLLVKPALFLPLFAMVLFRIGGLMLVAPFYGSQIIPPRVRVAMIVAISFVMFPAISHQLPVELETGQAVAGVFGELMIGLIMGTSMSLLFVGVRLAGRMVGQQAGLAMAQMFDPMTNTNATIFGQLFFWVTMTGFLIVGGHRELMRALLDTFEVIPVMSFRFNPSMLDLLINLTIAAYALALRLAGPMLIALMMASILMGFLSRTIPQINILTVGFAVRTFVAVAMASVVLSASDGLMTGAIDEWIERIREAFGLAV